MVEDVLFFLWKRDGCCGKVGLEVLTGGVRFSRSQALTMLTNKKQRLKAGCVLPGGWEPACPPRTARGLCAMASCQGGHLDFGQGGAGWAAGMKLIEW